MPKTSSGFEFEINPDAFDDWELIELLAEVGDGNLLKVPAVLNRLLGAESAKALKEHCRVDGKVTVKAMDAELTEILKAAGETKKKN